MFRAYVAWGRSLRCPRALGLIPGCSNGSDAGGPFRCIPPIGNPLRARALAWDWTITRECGRATFQSKTPSRSQPGVFHLSYRSILRTSSNRRDVMGFARVNRCSGHLV